MVNKLVRTHKPQHKVLQHLHGCNPLLIGLITRSTTENQADKELFVPLKPRGGETAAESRERFRISEFSRKDFMDLKGENRVAHFFIERSTLFPVFTTILILTLIERKENLHR